MEMYVFKQINSRFDKVGRLVNDIARADEISDFT